MKKLAVLAVAGLMSVIASASNWVLVTQSVNEDMVQYIDTDSITDDSLSGYTQAFSKIDFKEIQKIDGFENKAFDTVIKLEQFDCNSNPSKSKTISLLVKKGEYVVHSNDNVYSEWGINYPDSMGETATKFVCSY